MPFWILSMMESWWRKETSCLVGRTHIYILRGNVEGEDKCHVAESGQWPGLPGGDGGQVR